MPGAMVAAEGHELVGPYDRDRVDGGFASLVEGRYGLRQLPVRELDKALSDLLLMAVAHNLLRWIALAT